MNAASSWLDSVAARDRWQAALKSHGPRIAVWVLAIALGAEAASIVTRLAAGAGSAPVPAQLTAAAPEPARIDVAAIAAGHLFGAAPVAAPASATSAPQTTMALVLTGTIAVNRPQDGLAILGPSATQVKVYAVGDSVPGGARLHAVYDDRVLLDRAGRLETLTLPRKLAGGAIAPLVSSSVQNSFERVRRVISEDPSIIADVMRPQPVFADGKQRGYRVYPGRNSQAFMSLGLRPGDLVIAINNTPLDDPARGDEIFRTLGSSSEARVTVMRNGRQQDLTLNMSAVASEADQLSQEQPGAGGAVSPATRGGTGPQGPD
jgi:general secretion pathway protein C